MIVLMVLTFILYKVVLHLSVKTHYVKAEVKWNGEGPTHEGTDVYPQFCTLHIHTCTTFNSIGG